MNTHHRTCHECERHRQQAGDEAFTDMVVLAQFNPKWFTFGDAHVHHHDDQGVIADDVCDDPDMDSDHTAGIGFWD